MKQKDIQTNAPKKPSTGVTSAIDTKSPFHSEILYPGDSVDEHKKLEAANRTVTADEMRQQNESL